MALPSADRRRNNADVDRVIAVVTAAREPGLAVELGGKAISDTERSPLSTITAIGIVAAAIILLFALGSLFAAALPIATAVAGVGSGLMLMAPLSHLMSVTASRRSSARSSALASGSTTPCSR
jgi:putative drug exporter of the RND superfamily